MQPIRNSYTQYLTGRKLEKGKSKETALQECVNEVNEHIVKGAIHTRNIQDILRICVCKKTDDRKIFSENFIKNITELNKNENFIFKKIFPRSLQKFLAFLFITFESNRNTFDKPKESLLNIKLLNIKSFKAWLKENLNLSEKTYTNIIEQHYISNIFLNTENKVSLGRKFCNKVQFEYHKNKNAMTIGLLWNFEVNGYTTPKVRNIIENQFFYNALLIDQFLKSVNVTALEIEIKSIPKRSGSLSTNEFLEYLLEHSNSLPEVNKIKKYCYENADKSDGIIIPGGSDIEDYVYSHVNKTCDPYLDIRRTLADLFLIHRCVTKGIPLLGICRGCQIINVYFGGTIESVNDEHSLINTKNFNVVAKEDTRFKIFDENSLHSGVSLHRQCIEKLGDKLTVTSVSADNAYVVKSIETKMGSLVLGVQFHPEFYNGMKKFCRLNIQKSKELMFSNRQIFIYFFQTCQTYRNKKVYLKEVNKLFADVKEA
ncbi:gamma-glutamyl-gamma-aminobutyrate hydrolase family protein [Fluviispira vulneris]|uniref:gamma-glutamyl-gamma-aminobutyrate hydrolase family protein n=1 Tax=Fluviispira vulneris TaxID=2763012 RepID=UPI00164847E5|nr:gamma-glutamyl-gamma-aminobutyrate hydrolase family protein [Fluviispira vulneris]